MKYGGCIETYTGKTWNVVIPNADDVDIRDIAHSLARIQRFNGHANGSCSVAAHSVFVSRLVSKELALKALLHDAEESVTGDMARPVKELLKHAAPAMLDLILTNKKAIYEGLGIDFPTSREWGEIKAADNLALLKEARRFMNYGPVWKQDEKVLKETCLQVDVLPSCVYGNVQEDEKLFLDEYTRLTYDC